MGLFRATPADGAVWITGGSSGIGAETAKRLANQGFTVFVSARSKEDLEALADAYGKFKGVQVATAFNKLY